MKDVVVVIPIYRDDPPSEEQASFRQCLKVLGRYDIVLLTYEELDSSLYESMAGTYSCKLRKEFFDARYFKSVAGYNRLCLNPDLYVRFQDYRYMLIYQLDAWVFKDELLKWCQKAYDFIGAPWFVKNGEEYTYEFCDNLGNGGFSLRKISFCYKVLTRNRHTPILKPKALWRENTYCGFFGFLEFLKNIIGKRNNRTYYLPEDDSWTRNEDGFFTLFRDSYMKCHIPKPIEAISFSFEAHPSYLFALNNNELPFGCHAYRKFEYDSFWRMYIHDDIK